MKEEKKQVEKIPEKEKIPKIDTTTIQYGDEILKVKYKHNRPETFDSKKYRFNVNPKNGNTVATVEVDRFSKLSGIAECSKKDTFSKRLGREISFKRLSVLLTRLTPVETKEPISITLV